MTARHAPAPSPANAYLPCSFDDWLGYHRRLNRQRFGISAAEADAIYPADLMRPKYDEAVAALDATT